MCTTAAEFQERAAAVPMAAERPRLPTMLPEELRSAHDRHDGIPTDTSSTI